LVAASNILPAFSVIDCIKIILFLVNMESDKSTFPLAYPHHHRAAAGKSANDTKSASTALVETIVSLFNVVELFLGA
jgi:hypothetical protein